MTYNFYYEKLMNDVGYVMDSTNAGGNTVILFGRRDRYTVINVLEASFMITSAMSIDVRARHYWIRAPYYSFYELQQDGGLNPCPYPGDQDVNYNLFNLDFSYIWNFAPGSQISLMWKNAINSSDNDIENDYFHDFKDTMRSPASNSFSIRILYYLDALYFKKKKQDRS
jgi:hypothetical protein